MEQVNPLLLEEEPEMDAVLLKVKRKDSPASPSYWEEFQVPYKPGMNVISALMEIQRNPVTLHGKVTAPVVWESNCLEEVCGACSMLINGKARQACSTLIDNLPSRRVTLEPFSKFPVIRDLVVDRSRMFESLKRIKGWVPIDGTYDLGPGPRMPEIDRQFAYEISRCMTCGCCLEACPQVNDRSKFMGPAPIIQAKLFNSHPTGRMNAHERLQALLEEGGIADCGNAQNCVEVCPKEIPITTALAELNRDTILYALQSWLKM